MAKVTAHVWYTVGGNIVAVGQPLSDSRITPMGNETTSVLVADVDPNLIDKLHETHIVSAEQSLVPNAKNGSGAY
ncbi:hypothetical protein ACFC00_25325 [Streptomyces adustus]|uniref:hypothetical protein n=1 Tax=Streptomyces adustus TaxID=1609272 RepID=UPI0035D92E94